MKQNVKINPQDVPAYIVFQFSGLEDTLNNYQFTEEAQTVNLLKYVFIHQALNKEATPAGKTALFNNKKIPA